jgi:hypothetical protein
MNTPDLILSDFRSLIVLAVLAWALLFAVLVAFNHGAHKARSIERPHDERPTTPATTSEETDR